MLHPIYPFATDEFVRPHMSALLYVTISVLATFNLKHYISNGQVYVDTISMEYAGVVIV